MLFSVPKIEILKVERIEIVVEPWSWEFATTHRNKIDRHFARVQRGRPGVWNGRVLLLNRFSVGDGALRATCFETDYASFLAWREWDFPDSAVFNVFAAAALRGADGAYIVGEMAPWTAGAGQIYFPCGTPDHEDVDAAGMLDLAGSLRRELLEETGIDIGTLAAEPSWSLVHEGGFVALMKQLTAHQNADELRARIARYLANDPRPEFSDVRIVRGLADLDTRMPRFVVAYLEAVWRR